jgi:hypothetical protein
VQADYYTPHQRCMMNSNAGGSSAQEELPSIAGLSLSSPDDSNSCLNSILLHHPSISQDQQVVAKLLQTSKELQAAVAQHSAGQLHLVLQPRKRQQAEGLAQWLQKHGHLVCGLQVDLSKDQTTHSRRTSYSSLPGANRSSYYWAEAAASALEAGVLQAIEAGALQLQSFSLAGCQASASLMLQLPAAHLTQLHVEIDFSSGNSSSMWAVAGGLANLKQLALINSTPASAAADELVLQPLTAAEGLQHLTQLQLGPVRPSQLQCLQPLLLRLQQLNITADLGSTESDVAHQLLALAELQRQHAGIINSLALATGVASMANSPTKAALRELVSAMQPEAPLPAAAAAAAVAHIPAVLQLQSLSVGFVMPMELAGPLLRALPASSLTHLQCPLNWRSIAQLEALGRLTALRSCDLRSACVSAGNLNLPQSHALASQDLGLVLFSKLQQLTQLHLDGVGRGQLQQLQLPQLRELYVSCQEPAVNIWDASKPWTARKSQRSLKLSHLSAVQILMLAESVSLLAGDQLPPNLRELVLNTTTSSQQTSKTAPHLQDIDDIDDIDEVHWGVGAASAAGPSEGKLYWASVELEDLSFSVQPLLTLSRLQTLHIQLTGEAAEYEALAQLSRLTGLQELGVVCSACNWQLDSSATAAWGALPLRKLHLCGVKVSASLLHQLTAFQGLTSLCLVDVDAMQLAAVLQQLPKLQSITLRPVVSGVRSRSFLQRGSTSMGSSNAPASDAVESIATLLLAIGSLQELGEVCLCMELPVEPDGGVVQQLYSLFQQLLPNSLLPHCEVRERLHGLALSICEAADGDRMWSISEAGNPLWDGYESDHQDDDNDDDYQLWYAR